MQPERSHGGRRNGWWLLLLLAVVLVWWFWRPKEAADANRADAVADTGDAADLAEVDPDDILVDLKDDASDADVAAIEQALGIDLQLVSRQSLDERFYRAHVEPARRDALVAALAARADVETAEPDVHYQLVPSELASDLAGAAPIPLDGADDEVAWKGFPNDPSFKHQWHLRQIGMPKAWRAADGKGVVVAVIDTGVAHENYTKFHLVPDLAAVPFLKPYDFVGDGPHANDDHGHGTHVAGTIAQATHNGVGVAGVARAATIMPLKVLSASGSGSVAGIADAIRYAADEGAQVINMSLGGGMPSRVLARAVKYAHDKGVVVVCAAGNDGRGRVSYPAAYPGAIAVAATQVDESTTFYSNWGKEIDVAAPGGNTRVDQDGDGRPDGVLQNTIVVGDPTQDGYFAFMGTSMASPHVAGLAALVVGQGVTKPDAVEAILKETARAPNGKAQFDHARYGAGIIDAPAALAKTRRSKGGAELGLGLLLAAAVATAARRRGLAAGLSLGAPFVGAVVVGACGLFFLPDLLGGRLAGFVPLVEGLPSWTLAFGPSHGGNLLLMSAFVPVGLVAFFGSVRRMRAPLAGLAVGVAAHLLFHAAAPIATLGLMPAVVAPLWLLLNAAFLTSTAILVLRR